MENILLDYNFQQEIVAEYKDLVHAQQIATAFDMLKPRTDKQGKVYMCYSHSGNLSGIGYTLQSAINDWYFVYSRGLNINVQVLPQSVDAHWYRVTNRLLEAGVPEMLTKWARETEPVKYDMGKIIPMYEFENLIKAFHKLTYGDNDR